MQEKTKDRLYVAFISVVITLSLSVIIGSYADWIVDGLLKIFPNLP